MRWTEKQLEEHMKKTGKKYEIDKTQLSTVRSNKYNNKITEVDGIKFDSKKEAEYYYQLKLLKRAGEIKDFAMQQKYELLPTFKKNGTTFRSITYIADFVVVNNDGTTEVIDVKGMENQIFKIKQKLFEYMYPDKSLKIIK